MKSNQFIKRTALLIVPVFAGLVYLFAQHSGGLSGKKAVQHENELVEDETEDAGIPTGDDPWQEMDRLVTAYYSDKGQAFKGIIKLIDDNGEAEKTLEEYSFEYEGVQENFRYIIGSMEVIHKKEMVLVADHQNRYIAVSSVKNSSGKKEDLFNIGRFKELMAERKAEAKVTMLDGQKVLTIENIIDQQIQGYQVYYSPENYQVSKMLVGMLRLTPLTEGETLPGEQDREPDTDSEDETVDSFSEPYTYYMEIIYTSSKPLGLTKKTFRPEDRFIRVNKNKIELMPAFGHYELVAN